MEELIEVPLRSRCYRGAGTIEKLMSSRSWHHHRADTIQKLVPSWSSTTYEVSRTTSLDGSSQVQVRM